MLHPICTLSKELTQMGRQAAFVEGTCVGIRWLWSASFSSTWTAPASPTAPQFTLKWLPLQLICGTSSMGGRTRRTRKERFLLFQGGSQTLTNSAVHSAIHCFMVSICVFCQEYILSQVCQVHEKNKGGQWASKC